MTETPSTRFSKPTGETLYTIRFTTFEDQPTSRLDRKYKRKRERVKETRSCFHYVRSIEPLPYPVKMRCIQVDSPSHQYLPGRSMVPTHNSELGAALALNMWSTTTSGRRRCTPAPPTASRRASCSTSPWIWCSRTPRFASALSSFRPPSAWCISHGQHLSGAFERSGDQARPECQRMHFRRASHATYRALTT